MPDAVASRLKDEVETRLSAVRIVGGVLLFWLILYLPALAGRIACSADYDLWISVIEGRNSIDAWRAGGWAAWSPGSAYGYFLPAGAATMVYYPGLWLFSLLGANEYLASARVSAVHALFAALGMWLLLRELGMTRAAAMIGACLMVSSTRYLALYQAGIGGMQCFESYYPWLFWGGVRAARRDLAGGMLIAGLILGMQAILYSSLAHIAGFLVVLVALIETCWSAPRRPWRGLTIIAAVGGMGLLIGAAQLVPALSAAMASPRMTDTAAGIFQNILYPQQIILFFLPDFWDPFPTQVQQGWLYVGSLATLALLLGAWRNGVSFRYVAATIICLLFMVGDYLPFYRHLFYPFVPFVKGPLRLAGLIAPFLIVAAVPLLVELPARLRSRRAPWLIFVAGALIVAAYFVLGDLLHRYFIARYADDAWASNYAGGIRSRLLIGFCRLLAPVALLVLLGRLRAFHRTPLFALLLALCLDTGLSAFMLQVRDFRPPTTGYPAVIGPLVQAGKPGRVLSLHGETAGNFGVQECRLPAVRPVHALIRWDYVRTLHQAFPSPMTLTQFYDALYGKSLPSPDTRALGALGVRYLVLADSRTLGCPILGRDGERTLVEIPEAMPPYYLAPRWTAITPEDTVVRDSLVMAARGVPMVERGPSAIADTESVQTPVIAGTLLLQRTGGNHRVFTVEATRRCLLVDNEQFDPGWRCRVDGRERPILRVNGFLRGVIIEPGRHIVHFSFHSNAIVLGAAISIVAVLAWVCAAVWIFARRSVPPGIQPRTT